MGKKQGQDGAQRTKGNVKPSSSAKAAEMLQQISSSLASYSFGSDVTPLGVGTLMEESFDSNLDGDLRAALRKLYKKDMQTKLKALDELSCLIESKSQEECIPLISYWAKCYTKLTLDSERKIREYCQQTHEKMCLKVTKSLLPSLKVIMPYWILAQADVFIPAGKIAANAYKATFSENKQPEVIYFARDEILATLYDYLITQTLKTLSDPKTCSEDEAVQKYETIVSMSLRGLSVFVEPYIRVVVKQVKMSGSEATSCQASLEKLDSLLMNSKFWKFSTSTSTKIRGEFFQLLSSLIDLILLNESLKEVEATESLVAILRTNLKSKLVPIVFYSCDEDSNQVAYFVWQSILKCLKFMCRPGADYVEEQTSFWSLMNVKKTFLPKLIALLRHHTNGNANSQNAELVYVSLLPILSRLNIVFSTKEEFLQFLRDFFTRVNDGITKEITLKTRFNNGVNRNRMIDAFFDCAGFVIDYFNSIRSDQSNEFEQFYEEIILKCIFSMLDAYLDNTTHNTGSSGFEYKLTNFISNSIESETPCQFSLKTTFWANLNANLLKRIETSSNNPVDQSNLVNKLCHLFSPFWTRFNMTNKSTSLLNTIQIIFSIFLNKFKENSTDVANLKSIISLCKHFIHNSLISSFLAVNLHNDIDECFQKLISFESSPSTGFPLIDLYILLKNSKDNSCHQSVLKSLDLFLLTNNNTQKDLEMLDNIFEYYLNGEENNIILSWFLESDKFADLFIQVYLTDLASSSHIIQSKRLVYAEKFIKLTIDANSFFMKVNLFYDALVKLTVKLIGECLMNPVHLESEYLHSLVHFSNQLLFYKSKSITEQNTVWLLLINLFKLNSKLSVSSQLLENLTSKLTAKLFELIFDDDDSSQNPVNWLPDDFNQLTCFTIENITQSDNLVDYYNNDTILFALISQLIRTITTKRDPVSVPLFFRKILFRTTLNNSLSLQSFEEIFYFLISHSVDNLAGFNNSNLIRTLYLNERTTYLYCQYQHQTLANQAKTTELTISTIQWLKQIDYTLKIINISYSSIDEFILEVCSDPGYLTSEPNFWYYLILSGLVLNRLELSSLLKAGGNINYELTIKLVQEVKNQLNNLITQTTFLNSIFNHMDTDKFVTTLFDKKSDIEFIFQLNNLSYFFVELVEDNLCQPNKVLVKELSDSALKITDVLVNTYGNQQVSESLIKYYMYDIPFARYSVLATITQLNDDMEFYYTLFASLIQNNYTELLNTLRLFKLNSEIDLSNLKELNFKVSLLVKYSQIFLSFLTKSQAFSKSIATSEFIANTFSKHIVKLLDLFIDLKESSKIVTGSSGFFFHYTFDETDKSELKWNKFCLLNNFNRLLKIVFTDYSLITGQKQQISQFMSDKQWDFVMCFVAAVAQRLNKDNLLIRGETTVEDLLGVDFLEIVYLLVESLNLRVKEDLSGSYPKSIWTEWHQFFSKEIFDPILSIYVGLSSYYSGLHELSRGLQSNYLFIVSLGSVKSRVMTCLSRVVCQIPFERLVFNELEAKLNVLDEMNKDSSIKLTANLKTVINHLTPNLKHQISSVQMSSYMVLRSIMRKLSKYYETKDTNEDYEEDSNEKFNNIYESIPQVLRQTLSELTCLFSDLKSTVSFDQNILVTQLSAQTHDTTDLTTSSDHDEASLSLDNHSIRLKEICHDANNKFMSFLLVNSLILDAFTTENLDFKVRLVNNLREISFNDNLINLLFRLMPSFKYSSDIYFSEAYLNDITNKIDEASGESFQNRFVQMYACRVYKQALKSVPAMIRDWWNIQQKRVADQVEKYTIKYVSVVLIEEEIREINRSANLINLGSPKTEPILVEVNNSQPLGPAKKTIVIDDDETSTIKIRGMCSTREIVSTYKMKELNMELIIQLPTNYPLGVVEVSSVRRLGVSEQEWRNWLIQLTTYLTHQNGSIIQSLQVWKKNVDKKFDGVEECCICYNVIQGSNYQLPKKKCRTCKKLFHSICLYKWFESSSKSSCPLCRNLF